MLRNASIRKLNFMEKKDIEHLAHLARIRLADDEAVSLASDITKIIGYVSEIDEIAAEGSAQKEVGPLHNVMRKDGEPHESGIYTEDLLRAAPERSGQYIKVKKILDNGK